MRQLQRKDATSAQTLHHKQVAFKAEKVEDDGTFKGYASVFGNLDSYREIVAPGAFAESLKAQAESGDPLPALWQHRSGEPVGGYDVLREDKRGLWAEGFLLIGEVARAREAHAMLKRRVVKGMSIGYYVEESNLDEKTGIRTLTKLDLVEVSIVTFPANPLATVDSVKAAQTVRTIREFEDFLRDVGGFSAQRAKQIASAGWASADRSRDDGEEALKKTIEALTSFTLPQL